MTARLILAVAIAMATYTFAAAEEPLDPQIAATVDAFHEAMTPDQRITIDIVGVGPVTGVVRWAQRGKFGVRFDQPFDLARLAPKKDKSSGP